jgi:hypothetical protein
VPVWLVQAPFAELHALTINPMKNGMAIGTHQVPLV